LYVVPHDLEQNKLFVLFLLTRVLTTDGNSLKDFPHFLHAHSISSTGFKS